MDANEIKKYFDKMKDIQETLLTFLEDENAEFSFEKFIELINRKIDRNSQIEMKEFLHLISKISNNHCRSLNFIDKIEMIIKYYVNEITSNFSNYIIFNIFKKNKRLLLFLFKEKIIKPDQSIFSIISDEKYKKRFYPQYFYNEFKSFFDENFPKQDINKDFEEKRKIGENDNHICNLIRKDSLDEFVDYLTKNRLTYYTEINQSIFETNLFLLKNQKTTLIEYALFFGSIRIISDFLKNNYKFLPSFWIYAVHSNNQEIINLLEEKFSGKNDKPEIKSFKETIKCYHTNIMNYIKTKFNLNVDEEKTILHYFNFNIFNNVDCLLNDFNHLFYLFCKCDYITIVQLLLNQQEIDFNFKAIFNQILISLIIIIFIEFIKLSFHRIHKFIIL